MKPSEKVEIGLKMEPDLRREAKKKLEAAQFGNRNPDYAPKGRGAETAAVVAAKLGWSADTYVKARKVLLAATDESVSDEDRAFAQRLVEEMDVTGMVAPSYRELLKYQKRNGRFTLGPKQEAKAEAFETRVVALMHGCHAVAEAGVPILDSERKERLSGDLRDAIGALRELERKVESQ
jgi:hypothetical protein